MSKLNPLIQWWMTPKLPSEHVVSKVKTNNILLGIPQTFRKWFVHPIKRRVAKYYLIFLRLFTNLKVIGITGSAGKTTTKEMLASILKLEGKTIYSKDNIDPIYNIPSTILKLNPRTKYLVLEMGVEYQGEMDFYLWLAKPDIGIITNIFPTHTEFFGNREGVFKEKSKLVKNLDRQGFSVLNHEDSFLKKLKNNLSNNIIWFGEGSDINATGVKNSDEGVSFNLIFSDKPNETIQITLPLIGRQFVENALAATAVGRILGISLEKIKKGLESFKSADHRMSIVKHSSGAIIIDDSYNNNPEAAKKTIQTFNEYASKKDKLIVFGDMLELGELSDKYHMELGEFMGRINLVRLVCVGKNSVLTAESAAKTLGKNFVVHVGQVDDVYENIKPFLRKNAAILIKGSRSIHLDQLVNKLNK